MDCVCATSLHTRCSISQSNLPAVHAEVQVAAQAAVQAEVQVAVLAEVQVVAQAAAQAEVQVAAQAAAQAEVQVAVQVAVQAVRAAQAAQVVSYPQFSHETHYCKPHR